MLAYNPFSDLGATIPSIAMQAFLIAMVILVIAGVVLDMMHKKNVKSGSSKDDQDSVLIQRKKGGSATLKGTSKTSWPGKGKNVKVGKMKPGRTGEFDTKVKNKTFTYEKD